MGLSVEEIGELSFAEYTAAFRVWGDNERARSQEQLEIARLQSYWVIALTSTLKFQKPLKKPQDLLLFPWEEHPTQKKQSVEEMKMALKKIALMFGTKDKQNRKTVKEK